MVRDDPLKAGRPAADPRVLLALWLYATTRAWLARGRLGAAGTERLARPSRARRPEFP